MGPDGRADGVNQDLAFDFRKGRFDHLDDRGDVFHAVGIGDIYFAVVIPSIVGGGLHPLDEFLFDLLHAMDFGAWGELTFIADV